MRKIAIVDTRANFINDISTRLILSEDEYDFEIETLSYNPGDIDSIIDKNVVDELCISESLAKTRSDWDIVGLRVTTYTSNIDGVYDMLQRNTLCYGAAATAGKLLALIQKNEPARPEEKQSEEKNVKSNKSDGAARYNKDNDENEDIDALLFGDSSKKFDESDNGPEDNDDVVSTNDYEKPKADVRGTDRTHSSASRDSNKRKQTASIGKDNTNEKTTGNARKRNREQDLDRELFGDDYKPQTDARTLRDNIEKEEEEERQRDYLNADASIRKRKKRAHVITTYSAKGGVGKTTVACNLATYLAMSSNGRRKYRVCIIDYNFDFGDVLNTLSFDSTGVTMMDWAMDIKDRIDDGEDPDGIAYGREDIESYLQKNETSGLYALLAPVSHVDSLNIHSDELKVMINNILKYGDFDFVICDTGNNTRNSSMLSLEKADHIVMIVTQDVTTVYDNQIFLDAIKSFNNVDENRVLLVINKAKSKKETLISCKEVEESLNIPCVAHLKETPDVIKANNVGRPIVFNERHEYTKGIGNIAARITGVGTYEPVKGNVVNRAVEKVKDFFGF